MNDDGELSFAVKVAIVGLVFVACVAAGMWLAT